MSMPDRRDAAWCGRADLAAALALLLLVIGCWHGITAAFWRADDPALVLHALQSPGLAAFTDPADWQRLSPSNLTPWVTLSFKLDLALAGPDPAAFYLHQLLSAVLVALAAYALARRVLPAAWALLLVVLGLAGAPTAAVTELLMTRHYLEGLLFALLSLLAFLQARGGSAGWAWAGAAAYALAASAKEVYVPLVLVLACLPEARLAGGQAQGPARWRLLLPYVLVALGYVVWRRLMLGDAVGGYGAGESLLSARSAGAMAHAVARFPADLFGRAWPAVMVLALLASPLALWGRWRWLAFAAVAGAAVLLPLWPLAAAPGLNGPDRYLYLLWWTLAAGLVALLRGASSRLPMAVRQRDALGLGLGALLVLAAALQSAQAAGPRRELMRAFDAVGRFMVATDARSAFVAPDVVLATHWYVTALCEIRQRSGADCPQALIPGWALDDRVQRLAVYDPATGAMADASDRIAKERRRAAAIDQTRPLSITLALDGRFARWQLGPYRDGQYFLVSPVLGRYPMPPQGVLRTTLREVPLQVQFDAREGWRTASPVLVARAGQPLAWSRGAAPASAPGP
jgi:hypothetical protein